MGIPSGGLEAGHYRKLICAALLATAMLPMAALSPASGAAPPTGAPGTVALAPVLSDPAKGGAVPRTPLGTDPAKPGAFTTTSWDYTLAPVKLPEMAKPVEMVGHVVEPAADQATGARPFVLFLHGRNKVCYDPAKPARYSDSWPCVAPFKELPNEMGYDYLQKLLASQGYATVSIRANGINDQDSFLTDSGADARAKLIRKHLDHWVGLAAKHQVDLSKVTLVGHVHGGEGANRATLQIGLGAPYRIIGEVLLGATNSGSQTAPYVPIVTVLPECDGDVSDDLEGQLFVDAGRDLVDDDPALKSSIFIVGANTNYFNTEWTPGLAKTQAWDDGNAKHGCDTDYPVRLDAGEQRAAAKVIVAGAVQLFNGAAENLPLFDGTTVSVPSLGRARVFSHAIGGGRQLRRPGIDATATPGSGSVSVDICNGVLSPAGDPGRVAQRATSPMPRCGVNSFDTVEPHWVRLSSGMPWRRFAHVTWSKAGGVGGLNLTRPLDVSQGRLEMRAIVDWRSAPAEIAVRLTDANGAHADVTPQTGARLSPPRMIDIYTRLWAKSVVVDTSAVTGVDLTSISKVEIVAKSPRGSVWIADVAAAPKELPRLLAKRLPLVNFGTARIQEGDKTGLTRATVPFTITGQLTRPGRLLTYESGELNGHPQRTRVELAPGQTRGQVQITYPANRLDDYPTRNFFMRMWAVRGVVTDDYVGEAIILDDDPDAHYRVSIPKRVREGQPIVIRVRLTNPSATPTFVQILTGKVKGPQLRQNDLPRAWREGAFGSTVPNRTLGQSDLMLSERIRSGTLATKLVIPTRWDRRREKTELVRLSVSVAFNKRYYTVRVLNRPR